VVSHPKLILTLVLVSGCATVPAEQSRSDIARLVGELSVDPLTLAIAEKAFGTKLVEAQGTSRLRLYQADNLRYGKLQISHVSYSDPLPNAQFGPLITLDFSGPCLKRQGVLDQFQGLVVTQAPRGHSIREETVYSRQTAVGRLSFGFAESAPDCLRSVTIRNGD